MSKLRGFFANNPILSVPGTTISCLERFITCFMQFLKLPSLLTRLHQNALLFHIGTIRVPLALSAIILSMHIATNLGGGTNQFSSCPQNLTASVPGTHHLELNLLHLLFRWDANLSIVYGPKIEFNSLKTLMLICQLSQSWHRDKSSASSLPSLGIHSGLNVIFSFSHTSCNAKTEPWISVLRLPFNSTDLTFLLSEKNFYRRVF